MSGRISSLLFFKLGLGDIWAPAATELIKFPRPLESFYQQPNWTYLVYKRDLEYHMYTAGHSFFVGLQNINVYFCAENMSKNVDP